MKLFFTFFLLLASPSAFSANLNCSFISEQKDLFSKTIKLADGQDEEFKYDVKSVRDDFQIEIWTTMGQKISMIMLSHNATKVSTYSFHAMGGEESMNVNLLVQSIPFELTCYIN